MLKRRQQNLSVAVCPAQGIFGRRNPQNARAEIALLLGEGAQGRQRARLSSRIRCGEAQCSSTSSTERGLESKATHTEMLLKCVCITTSFPVAKWDLNMLLWAPCRAGTQGLTRDIPGWAQKVNIFQRARQSCWQAYKHLLFNIMLEYWYHNA